MLEQGEDDQQSVDCLLSPTTGASGATAAAVYASKTSTGNGDGDGDEERVGSKSGLAHLCPSSGSAQPASSFTSSSQHSCVQPQCSTARTACTL